MSSCPLDMNFLHHWDMLLPSPPDILWAHLPSTDLLGYLLSFWSNPIGLVFPVVPLSISAPFVTISHFCTWETFSIHYSAYRVLLLLPDFLDVHFYSLHLLYHLRIFYYTPWNHFAENRLHVHLLNLSFGTLSLNFFNLLSSSHLLNSSYCAKLTDNIEINLPL